MGVMIKYGMAATEQQREHEAMIEVGEYAGAVAIRMGSSRRGDHAIVMEVDEAKGLMRMLLRAIARAQCDGAPRKPTHS